MGHDASLAGGARWQRPVAVHPEWEVKQWDSVMTDDTIAIYPDAYVGNPYHARRVVRWALYYPGQRDGQSTFDLSERVYYYADLFRDATNAANTNAIQANRLYVGVFEPHYLFADARPKEYDAFWVGRGSHIAMCNLYSIGNVRDMYEFQFPFRTRAEFARALRKVGRFFSFDPCSAMIPEAALCGARTFHINADGVLREIHMTDPEMLHAFDKPYAFLEYEDVWKFVQDMASWS